jgi:hypothetical protein
MFEKHFTGYTVLKMNKSKGQKELLKNGFIQCINKEYFRKENIYVHYNNFMKLWIVERD